MVLGGGRFLMSEVPLYLIVESSVFGPLLGRHTLRWRKRSRADKTTVASFFTSCTRVISFLSLTYPSGVAIHLRPAPACHTPHLASASHTLWGYNPL